METSRFLTEVVPHMAHAPTEISTSTAVRWIRYLGFNMVKASKGWFTDGHEREGVVKYGDEHFLEKMK